MAYNLYVIPVELFIVQQPIWSCMRVSCRACTHMLVYILEFAQSTFTLRTHRFLFVCSCQSSFCVAEPSRVCVCLCLCGACAWTSVLVHTETQNLDTCLCYLRNVHNIYELSNVPVYLRICLCNQAHLGAGVSGVCVFCLKLPVSPQGIVSQGSYQTWVIREVESLISSPP